MSAGKIAALVLVVLLAAAGVASKLGLLKNKVVIPESIAMPVEQMLPPLSAWSEADRGAAAALAVEICRAINEQDHAALLKTQDIEGVVERSMAGFKLGARDMAEIKRGASDSMKSKPGGLFAEILGGRAKYLRLIDIQKQGSALIRILGQDGSVTAFYIMPRFRTSGARMQDAYMLATGAFLSESLRDVMIPLMAAANAGSAEEKRVIAGMEAFTEAKQSGDTGKMLSTLRALPPEVRNRSTMRAVYLQCLMSQEDTTEYQQELQRIEREEPESPATAMKLLDLYVLRKEWQLAADAGLKTDKFLGGDAYIKSLTGLNLAYAGKTDEAEALFNEAEKMEPDLSDVIWFRIHLDCARKDFSAAVKTLDRIKAAGLNTDLGTLVTTYPGLEPFLKSEEYNAWSAAQ